jgi:hypothetical protein
MVSRDATINDLLDLLAGLQNKEDRTRVQLAEIESQKEAVQITIKLYQEQHQPPVPREQGVLVAYVLPNVEGMTQVQALNAIADANGGELKLSDARKHMIASGFFRGSKNIRRNSGPQLRSLVTRSEEFEYLRSGVFIKIQPPVHHNGVPKGVSLNPAEDNNGDGQPDSDFTPNKIGIPVNLDAAK